VSGARISEVPLDEGVKAETFVQLAREQQPSIGGDRGSAELDAKLGIEREANRARCRVTHGMMPSGPARSRPEPHFLRVLRDYGLIRSPPKTKMWVLKQVVLRHHISLDQCTVDAFRNLINIILRFSFGHIHFYDWHIFSLSILFSPPRELLKRVKI